MTLSSDLKGLPQIGVCVCVSLSVCVFPYAVFHIPALQKPHTYACSRPCSRLTCLKVYVRHVGYVLLLSPTIHHITRLAFSHHRGCPSFSVVKDPCPKSTHKACTFNIWIMYNNALKQVEPVLCTFWPLDGSSGPWIGQGLLTLFIPCGKVWSAFSIEVWDSELRYGCVFVVWIAQRHLRRADTLNSKSKVFLNHWAQG